MDKKKIIDDYNIKIKLIEKYNEYYFSKSNPLVDDREYDQLKKNIILLEKKFKFLTKNNSVLNNVGFKPSKNFTKSSHKIPMLSLSNAFSKDDLISFEKKNNQLFVS